MGSLPPEGQRFSAEHQPARNGRGRTRWIQNILAETSPEGQPFRERVIRHLIEVATRWEVRVMGRDMEVASGRDAVEAAKLLLSYDVGKPPESGAVELPPGMDTNRSTLDIALETYRERLLSGEMSEDEFASMTQLLMGAEKAEAEMIARILGDRKGSSSALKDRVESLLSKLEARLGVTDVPAVPALPAVEAPSEAQTPEKDKPCP